MWEIILFYLKIVHYLVFFLGGITVCLVLINTWLKLDKCMDKYLKDKPINIDDMGC